MQRFGQLHATHVHGLRLTQVGRYHHPVARRFESGQQQQQQKSFNKVRYSQSGSDSQLGILQEQQGSSKYVDAKDLQIATLQLEKQLQQLEANLRAQLASKEDIKELKKELKESITFLTSGVAFIVLFLVASNLDKVQGWFK